MKIIDWLVVIFFALNVGFWAKDFNAGSAAFMLMIVLLQIEKNQR